MADTSRRDEFCEAVMLHRNRLFSFVYAHVRRMEDAEDILQQTVASLWEHFEQFEAGTNFLAWAIQVARNNIYDWHKANKRQPVLFGSQLSNQLSELIVEQSHQSTDSQNRIDALAVCMDKLAVTDRTLIKSCYAEQSSIVAVAESLNRTASSVYNSLRRIRFALLTCIERTISKEGWK